MKDKKIVILFIVLALIVVIVQMYNTMSSKDEAQNTNTVVETTNPDENINKPQIIKPKQVIVNDIDNLIKANNETIVKYFGESNIYRGIDVADRLAIAKITFASININGNEIVDNIDTVEGIENGIVKVNLHICTLDYNKTKEQVKSLTEQNKANNPFISDNELTDTVTTQVAEQVQTGNMDLHINVPVEIYYTDGIGKLQITEEFKYAITGGWYNPTGTIIESVECPLKPKTDNINETGESLNE